VRVPCYTWQEQEAKQAQAAHAAGCAMGVVPQGTFNYFARTHGIPADPTAAVRLLLRTSVVPVQVAGINDRVFLVNASLGLYPELLEDREAYKARFGRSRWVAFVAGCATLLRAQRRLRLRPRVRLFQVEKPRRSALRACSVRPRKIVCVLPKKPIAASRKSASALPRPSSWAIPSSRK
jgi:diacylglycerol kinase family enzyme